jgi:hypothetical protein
MKRSYIIYGCLAMLAILLYSCKKDIDTTTLTQPAGVTAFTASASQLVLSTGNDSSQVITFTWNAPDYGFKAAITYTLLFDTPADTSGANAWANATRVNIAANTLQKSYLGTDFNKLLNQLGLPVGTASTLVVRLKADVNQSTGSASTVAPLYSTVALTVTPYKVVLIYPKLYIAGDFLSPSWTQKDQPGWILAAPKSDGVYEGYINFTNTDNKFKLCTTTSWSGTNYGWGSSATTISSTGGDLYVAGPAYCKVNADVNALTVSYTPTSWRIAGDFNSWSLSATPMTFNSTTNVWTATNVSLTAGTKFKFEGDANWTTQIGVDSKGDLVNNGGDIIVAKTGTFTVTLDLSGGAGNYVYTVK